MLQIVAAGHVGKAGELRTTQSGTKVLNFSVGTDVGFGQNKKTVWLECAMFGDRAEKLTPYITRGLPVTVVGEGGFRQWESNGKSGANITCNVRELTMQGTKREGDTPQSGGGNWDQAPDMDDQIPF